MVPEEAYETLVEALYDEEVQRSFASLGVDQVGAQVGEQAGARLA